METTLTLSLLIVVGLVLILAGANYLTDGSAAIARRLNISGFVIGLTIVAIGTSMPEMVVSVISAMKGNADISIGNVVGSNTFNTLVILGICSLVNPIILTQHNIYRDIPFGILASLALVAVAWGGEIVRWEGALMLAAYVFAMVYTLRNARPSKEEAEAEKEVDSQAPMSLWLAVLFVVGGLAALIYGGRVFLNNSIELALKYNIPDNVIAVTLVAGGTSLPEFAASLVSLIKGKSDIALGNVIGSNVANILLVLGFSSTMMNLTMGSVSMVDICIVLFASIFVFLTAFTFGKRKMDRIEGLIMVACYVAYIAYILN